MTVGRSDETDICLDQKSISRKHAEIVIDESCQKATVTDFSSMNGTFYKGKRVKSVEIFDGEQIEFGDITCKFVTDVNAEGNFLDWASVDDMTKTFNRRYFNEFLAAEFKKSVDARSSLSMIMFDIDRFKKINDTYGHSAGDYILKALCSIVFPLLTERVIFARIGGEEFAILLSDVKKLTAVALAETLRQTVEEYRFSFNEETIPVTLSFGVTERTDDLKNDKEFVSKTDSLLYLAKNTGRNKVCY